MVIKRSSEIKIQKALDWSLVVAILGPRQCGKTTLARQFILPDDSIYLDLQNRVDINKLSEPELFFDQHRHQLIFRAGKQVPACERN